MGTKFELAEALGFIYVLLSNLEAVQKYWMLVTVKAQFYSVVRLVISLLVVIVILCHRSRLAGDVSTHHEVESPQSESATAGGVGADFDWF